MNKSYLTQVVFIVFILIAVISINLLLVVLSILSNLPAEYLPPYLVAFALVSFGLTTILSAYHLSTMVRRKKRKTDAPVQPAAA
jgi:hypothetical protein